MASELIQIYYDDAQRKEMYDVAIPYYNPRLTVFFENFCIERLVMSTTAPKISVCSWKLRQKMKWYIGRPRPITQELLDSDYDVLSFTKNTQNHQMLAIADKWHPGFMQVFRKIMEAIGKRCPGEVKNAIYQNHFSAKTEIYQHYVKTYLSPSMDAIQNDREINKLAMVDSNYSKLDKTKADDSEYLMKQIGVPYYPLVPFLLERLFPVYCQNENINVSWL